MKVGGFEFPAGVADLPCPDCAVYMELVPNPYRNGAAVMYRCPVDGCKGSHGAHPDGAPVGRPASAATKQARIRAHAAFDAFWKGMGMRRSDAYRWLAKQLGLALDDCHIGSFSFAQCDRVVDVCAPLTAPNPAGGGPHSRVRPTEPLRRGRPGRHRRRPS